METQQIIVSATIKAPIEKIWDYYNDPIHITQWNHASDDWHSSRAESDLRVGGTFNYRMEAVDGSEGFDFEGTFTEIVPNQVVAYDMSDGRKVRTVFEQAGEAVKVTTAFDPEQINTRDLQQQGWQAILDNFKQYVEAN